MRAHDNVRRTVLLLLVLILGIVVVRVWRPVSTSMSAPAPAASPASTPPALPPDNFRQWGAAYQRAPDQIPITAGIELAKKRRAELKELIPRDPERALAMALPERERENLPAEVRGLLEEHVSGRGFFGVMIADFEDGRHETRRIVQLGDKEYRAFTYGRRLAQTSKQNVPLWGIAVDDVLAVGELPFRVVEENGAGRVTVEVAGQRRTFESSEQLRQYEAAWLAALAKPGPDCEEPK
jgi:hypothetical protein